MEKEQAYAELALWSLLDIYSRMAYPVHLFKKRSSLGWKPGPVLIPALIEDPHAAQRMINRHADMPGGGVGIAHEEAEVRHRVETFGGPDIRLMMARLDLRRAQFDPRRYGSYDFEGCNLEEADLSGHEMFGWNLRYANLKGAILASCTMSYVSFLCSDVSWADFSYTQLNAVEFLPAKKVSINKTNSNFSSYRKGISVNYSTRYD